ncbi:thymidylate kinase [Micromonospora qiuiae]|uniref:Thymidylate kinase n=1 Tax=Micromonospora qiuiae TaxID=502268 RepID=A0ABQ4JHD7_9ACTN|nr:dTMP kinase [Micromonospora qiuiae]GIJ29795.1 thymidylate kinase [Micromonospora qiuiae]
MSLFVAVEGIDHSGKTTLVEGLCQTLTGRGVAVGRHKEPTSAPIGSLLRSFAVEEPACPAALALLSAADRHHQQPTLRALLREAQVVISDRYYLSGLAYHLADGIDPAFYASSCAGGVRMPDVYLYLDVPVPVAAERVDRPPDSRWETREFTSRLPGAYHTCLALLRGQGADVVGLDAQQPAPAVLASALAAIEDRLSAPTLRGNAP